jgi:hypothetical protein
MSLGFLLIGVIAWVVAVWLVLRVRSSKTPNETPNEGDKGSSMSFRARHPLSGSRERQSIPKWSTPGAELADATRQQRRFLEWWTREFDRGSAPDVQGNLTYIFVHLYERIAEYLKNPDLEALAGVLERILDAYGHYDVVKRYAAMWLGNAYVHHRLFDEAWDVFRSWESSHGGLHQILWVRENCKENTIDGHDFFRCVRTPQETPPKLALTDFGRDHFDQVLERANAFLSAYHEVNGVNWITSYVGRFDVRNLSSSEIETLRRESDCGRGFDERVVRYEEWRAQQLSSNDPDSRFREWFMLFSSPPGHYQAGTLFECVDAVPRIVGRSLVASARRIVRSLEDSVRVRMGVPKIGQGWVSETLLFNQIKARFQELTVIQHYSPDWLGHQHLDVYVKEGRIGIEYQGAQHSEPVALWGGEEGLTRQRARDERKRVLCQRHGCNLIYAHPGYEFEEIAESIANMAGGSGRGKAALPIDAACVRGDNRAEATPRTQLSVWIPSYATGIKERLEKHAEVRDRSVNYLVVEAILAYLNREERRG